MTGSFRSFHNIIKESLFLDCYSEPSLQISRSEDLFSWGLKTLRLTRQHYHWCMGVVESILCLDLFHIKQPNLLQLPVSLFYILYLWQPALYRQIHSVFPVVKRRRRSRRGTSVCDVTVSNNCYVTVANAHVTVANGYVTIANGYITVCLVILILYLWVLKAKSSFRNRPSPIYVHYLLEHKQGAK